MVPDQHEGHFWGPIDAMHQFCEAKYEITPLVAEFWNAVSNVPFFILPGLYCLYRGRTMHDWRIHVIWGNMVLVGVGSLMFHGTMRFKWELLDEMPMILLCLCGVFSKDEAHWLTSGWRKKIVHTVSVGTASSGMYWYVSGGSYGVFITCFTSLALLASALACVCAQKPDKHGSYAAWGCFVAYAFCLTLGRVVWEVEVHFCAAGSGEMLASLHVLWHLLAAFACYFGALGDAQIRYMALGIGVAVDDPERRWPFLWVVESKLRPTTSDRAAIAKEGR